MLPSIPSAAGSVALRCRALWSFAGSSEKEALSGAVQACRDRIWALQAPKLDMFFCSVLSCCVTYRDLS